MILATALGSLVTVPLMAAFGWRWAFVIIGAAGLAIALPLVLRHVPDTTPSQPPRIDRSAGFRRLPDYWLFALGGLFVVVTLFLPNGIIGLVRKKA